MTASPWRRLLDHFSPHDLIKEDLIKEDLATLMQLSDEMLGASVSIGGLAWGRYSAPSVEVLTPSPLSLVFFPLLRWGINLGRDDDNSPSTHHFP